MSITDILVKKNLLTQLQLDEVTALIRAQGLRLDHAIIQLGFLNERQLLETMGECLNIPLANLDQLVMTPETRMALPTKFIFRKRLVPISRENEILGVATSDAFDLSVFDDIRLLTGLKVQPFLAVRDEIEKLIKAHYGVGGDTVDEMVGVEGRGATPAGADKVLGPVRPPWLGKAPEKPACPITPSAAWPLARDAEFHHRTRLFAASAT